MFEAARLATPEDFEAIDEIASRCSEAMTTQRGGAIYLRREAGIGSAELRLGHLVGNANVGMLVAGCFDGVVFGYAAVEYATLHDGSLLGRLNEFVVDAEVRKSGIGEAMMDLVVDGAKANGCFGIDSVALPGDRNTKNFFESFGLKARLLTVHRSLTEDD